MKRFTGIIIGGFLILALVGFIFDHITGSGNAFACGRGSSGSIGNSCGWNSSEGGKDYVPQKRGSFTNKPALTEDQAQDIVENHVKRLNPDLRINDLIDAGSYFEAEILAANGEIVQVLGVDKESGKIIVLN